MRACFQANQTPRYPRKGLFHSFGRRRDFLFENDFSRFIQNAIERPTISQIQTDGQLLPFENVVAEYLHSANLLHRRSPFLCASSTSKHWERIASRGDRPSHPIW